MRFSTVAIAAAAFGGALAQGPPGEYTTSATTTYTITRTVSHVQWTTTATLNDTLTPTRSSVPTWTSTGAHSSASAYKPSNGTVASPTSTKPAAATGAAARFGMDAVGLAAVAGFVGLVAL